MKICPKCKKEHQKEGKFCSRPCANSRGPRSKEFKETVSKKLKKRIDVFCKECGKKYDVVPSRLERTKYCSNSCAAKYKNKLFKEVSKETREKISESRKKLFESGELNVSGGRTKWIKYKNIKVQGSYEYRTCFILDNWLDKGLIKSWSYTKDRLTYTNKEGKSATYLLDFKVEKNDGEIFYIETKGFLRENDELKFEAAKEKGLILLIWFEEDILKYENAEVADVVLALS